MARKNRPSASLPTTQATPPIRFAPEDEKRGKKNSKAKACKGKSSCVLTRWLFRFGFVYMIYALLWRCSTEPFSFTYKPDHELLVCREMSAFQQHVSPVLHEYATDVHKKLDPYVGKYMNAAHGAWTSTKPLVHKSAKQAHSLYWSHVEPGARELYKQVYKWSLPHQRKAHAYYKKNLRPHVKKASKTMQPYMRTYNKDVHPHVLTTWSTMQDLHDKSSKYYVNTVHPSLKSTLYNAYVYVRHTLYPLVHKRYVKHAHPHVTKLQKQASAAVDEVLTNVKDNAVVDTLSQKVQETYEQVEKVDLSSSIVKEDVDVDATAAPSVVESEKDEASMSDEDKVLQARLDAELAATESALREHEQAMTSLTMSERKKIAQTIGEMRKESVIKIPERLDMVLSNGLDQGISSVFIRTLRAFGALASKIGNMDAPSDSWEEKAQALVAKELDTLVEVYDEIREKVRYVLYASREMEQELIQESVAKVRALSREAVRGFFDVMEKVEFQVTYFENEGWDSAMRRRGRFHREAIERDLMAMSSLGDLPDDNAVTMAPNLAEETKQINTGVDQLFKQAEHGFTALCDRMTQDPSILSDEAKYALLLIDMHAHLDMLAHLVEQQQRSAMLRLRETIGDLREYFNMTRVPPSGALHDIADFPLPVTPSQDTDSPEGVLDVPVPVPELAEDMAIPSATPAAGAGLDDEDAQPSVTMTSTAPASASPSSDEISSLDDDSLTSDILEEALTTSSEPEPTHAAELGEDNVLSAEPESHSITESESTVTSTWTVEDAFTTSDPATLTLDPSVLTSEEMAMPTDADVFPFVDDVRDLSPDAMLSTVIDTLPTETLEPMAGIETWPPHSDVSASVIVDISSPVAETQQPTASVTLDVQHGDMDDAQEMTRTSSHQAPSMRKVARMPRSSSSSELHASSAVSHDEL